MDSKEKERLALLLCDLRGAGKGIKTIASFAKKFVTPSNVDMFVVYPGSKEVEKIMLDAFKDYGVPIAIVDTYEWGQEPSFVLVVTDDEKSPIESVARHHFKNGTFAVITMMMCGNG